MSFPDFDEFDEFHTEPVLDEPRMREVLAFLRLHPELWNQTHYRCGTTGCLAGWTVALDEQKTMFELDHLAWGYPAIPMRAQELLGLTDEQAHELFTFTGLADPAVENAWRHPTFAEFCAKVEQVTGLRFKEPADA